MNFASQYKMRDDQVNHPIFKVASVGAAWFAGMTWGELASMMACGYTLLLIVDWFWKRFGKTLAIRRGWIKGRPRDFMDSTGRDDLV